ncbi:hypothetical protein ABU614_08550 [Lysobacter firmicutimachus]|uniref:J domain-containing protein n=1 Tax=Lysobacter firmicutimachus TaxID=1792846 RepID=A0AAU8MZN6_9GAMM
MAVDRYTKSPATWRRSPRRWGHDGDGAPLRHGDPRPGLHRFYGAAATSRRRARGTVVEGFGVVRDAHVAEVEAAYRRRRADAYPDRGGSAEAFGRVQRAFDQHKETVR